MAGVCQCPESEVGTGEGEYPRYNYPAAVDRRLNSCFQFRAITYSTILNILVMSFGEHLYTFLVDIFIPKRRIAGSSDLHVFI